MNIRRSSIGRDRGGFTLLEVIIALTIVGMLSGTLFAIISGSMKAVSQTQVFQSENDQVEHLIRLCRQAFQSLPSTATVTIKTTDSSLTSQQEITISGSPQIFGFGPNPISYKDTVIGLRPNAKATEASEDKQTVFDLGITREDIVPADPGSNSALVRASGEGLLAPDDQGRVWMPLLSNVASLTWRAYKNDDEQWVDEWDSTNLPLLVEMNLQMSGTSQPIRAVFSLPVLKLAGANPALAPKKTPTTGTVASANPSGGAQGGNPRGGGDPRRGGDSKGGDPRGGRGFGKGGPQGQPRGGPPGAGRQGGGAAPAAGGAKGGAPAAGGAAAGGGGGKK